MKNLLLGVVISCFLLLPAQVQAISLEDSNFAFKTIVQTLYEWNCTPLRIQFGGDDLNNPENVAYMNELADGQGFKPEFSACMVFFTDFRSPKDDGSISAWNFDSVYENYSWFFGLYSDGTWKLMTSGY